MSNDKDQEWGNISLPGLSDEELFNTNWNRMAVINQLADMKRGQTKETNEGMARQSIKIKQALSGRSKETHESIRRQADKIRGRKNPKLSKPGELNPMYGARRDDLSSMSKMPWKCQHCLKEGTGLANYSRWHGDNCKHKK